MTRMPATQVAGIFMMGCMRGGNRDQGALFRKPLDRKPHPYS